MTVRFVSEHPFDPASQRQPHADVRLDDSSVLSANVSSFRLPDRVLALTSTRR
jgi:hypothetical protein